MKFSDPILWACVGVVVLGFVFLIWAIGRLRVKKTEETDPLLAPLPLAEDLPMPPLDLDAPPPGKAAQKNEPIFTPAPSAPPPSSVLTTAFSKEVSDRLESMTQHLSEMQSVLTKQASSPAASAPTGGLGQGLSPETIDKLMKIIGNVVQQVDVLQKSLNVSKETPAAPAAVAPKSAFGAVFTAPIAPAAPKIASSPKP